MNEECHTMNFDDLRYSTGRYYTIEKNKQIIISLLKQYGIKSVVVSPGATNYALVGSLQHDSYFKLYSCIDERSAAYMAIGLSLSSNEVVVLSCTGATASRNYMTALTEAYKKNIPILVITSSLSLASVGQLKAQVTDRAHSPFDMIYKSYQFDNIKDAEDEWITTIKCNEALNTLLLVRKPILINVCTTYSSDFSVKSLPQARYIPTYARPFNLPSIPDGNIAIFIGSHDRLTVQMKESINRFCSRHNAAVFCDHTSGYNSTYRVNMAFPFSQERYQSPNKKIRLLIHIGEISGDYYTVGGLKAEEVWRVSTDGNYSDFFKRLSAVFSMRENEFFDYYEGREHCSHIYLKSCLKESAYFEKNRPDVPFSNIWCASVLSKNLPQGSVIHLGILNSLRSWNFFQLDPSIRSYSNVGGFGIDGCVSSLFGAACVNPKILYYGVVGDLTFYYDANILLNKPFPKNIRLLVINNGRGVEFRNYCHAASRAFGKSVDAFIAAAGHNGCQIHSAISELCTLAGIEYLHADNKFEFSTIVERFTQVSFDHSMVLEVFTEPEDESEALRRYNQCIEDDIYKRNRIKRNLAHIKSQLFSVVKKVMR